ncbi:N-acetylmuramoyl-L-alanine amidase [Clostridium perfringens]|nr:N-acetylmuramoyl-L-alanine amidase [Clostridium perfringens]
MKISERGGHNFQATGAVGLINETVEDRKVLAAAYKYTKAAGHDVLDVTPGNCDANTDLILGVNKAERFGAELFLSFHFDKCYDQYDGALGVACWICAEGGKAEEYARSIVNTIAAGTGLVNRGVKVNPKLYELRKTSMPAVIVEVCFCEATEDVRIYKEKGADLIGKLIAEGVCKVAGGKVPGTVIENVEYEVHESKPVPTYDRSKFKTNATAKVALDPRDRASEIYEDLGEIYAGERIYILPEVCDNKIYLPVLYWKDGMNRASNKVWVNSKQSVLSVDTNAKVINVVTELDARYTPSQNSDRMGYVKNGERLLLHKIEGNYALCTYFAGEGYKTAWFTKKYIEIIQ